MAERRSSIKKQRALGFAVGGIVGLPINVLLDVLGGRERARLGELRGGLSLGAGGLVDAGDDLFGQDLFGDQCVLKEVQRILGGLVLFDFLLVAIGVVRVGDGVAAVTVGADLEDAREVLVAG